MNDALLVAVSGGAGSIALILAALRLTTVRRYALKTATTWTRTSGPKAAAILGIPLAAAIAWFSSALPHKASHTLAVHLDSLEMPDKFSLLATAPGASREPPGIVAFADESGRKEKALTSLRDFAHRVEKKRTIIASLGSDEALPAETSALPDVDTMMDRLRARLETYPDDLKGWMTLGWAYANTGQYPQATAAYETALKLDNGNSEIKSALEHVKSKAAASPQATE